LQERGILYLPDFLVNRMGIVNCADEAFGSLPHDPRIEAHLGDDWNSIYNLSLEVLRRAQATGETPARVALDLAEERRSPPASFAPEEEHVLRRQALVALDEIEAGGKPFGEHLLDRHPVLEIDVGGGLALAAVFDQRHPAVSGERPAQVGEHLLGFLELVVDVDEEDQVDTACRELGICLGAEDRLDVADPLGGGELTQPLE